MIRNKMKRTAILWPSFLRAHSFKTAKIEAIACCILPDILAFYESMEGQRESAERKKQRKAKQEDWHDEGGLVLDPLGLEAGFRSSRSENASVQISQRKPIIRTYLFQENMIIPQNPIRIRVSGEIYAEFTTDLLFLEEYVFSR